VKWSFKILSVLFVGTLELRSIYIPSFTILGIYPQIDNIFSILLLFYVIFNSIKKPPIKELSLPIRYTYYFIGFYLIIFSNYVLIKDIIFHDESSSLLFKRVFRDIIDLYLILFIIYYSKIYNFRLLIIKTINIVLIILIISSIFADWFLSIGLLPNIREIHGIDRNTGFLGMNANEAAIFYNIIFGFGLATLESYMGRKQKYIYYLLIVLSVIAVILMVSKTGFVILISLLLLFFYRNVKKIRFFLKEIIVILVILFAVYLWIGDKMSTRIQYQFSGKEDTFSTRMTYNQLYLGKIFSDKSIFWYGHTDQTKPHSQNPHNLLIFTFYYGGVTLMLIFLFLYLRMVWISISSKYHQYSYIFLPVIIGSFVGFPDYTLWFPMLAGFIFENSTQNNYLLWLNSRKKGLE